MYVGRLGLGRKGRTYVSTLLTISRFERGLDEDILGVEMFK